MREVFPPFSRKVIWHILFSKALFILSKLTGTSILEAIQESMGAQTEVVYQECPTEATIETGDFSYAVVVVGEVPVCT
jgi:hypothetical protein